MNLHEILQLVDYEKCAHVYRKSVVAFWKAKIKIICSFVGTVFSIIQNLVYHIKMMLNLTIILYYVSYFLIDKL